MPGAGSAGVTTRASALTPATHGPVLSPRNALAPPPSLHAAPYLDDRSRLQGPARAPSPSPLCSHSRLARAGCPGCGLRHGHLPAASQDAGRPLSSRSSSAPCFLWLPEESGGAGRKEPLSLPFSSSPPRRALRGDTRRPLTQPRGAGGEEQGTRRGRTAAARGPACWAASLVTGGPFISLPSPRTSLGSSSDCL